MTSRSLGEIYPYEECILFATVASEVNLSDLMRKEKTIICEE